MKHVPPSVRETAFNCPHCHALTTQFWYITFVKELREERGLPNLLDRNFLDSANFEEIEDVVEREKLRRFFEDVVKGYPLLSEKAVQHFGLRLLHNVHVSRCFNCQAVSVWLYDKLVYPNLGEAPRPNPDLSEEIRRDYAEASSILDLSPRGTAALLRVAIQKLCKDLGLSGNDLNADIGALVERGLDVRIQRALDTVRVIGNNAVHPGQMDLRDDRATAEHLFSLVNFIAKKIDF